MKITTMAGLWRRLWGSVAFRLTFNYGLLAVCTTIFLLLFAYGKIIDVLQSQFSRQVTLSTQRLVSHYHEGGLEPLLIEIRQLLSDQTDIDTEMYLLIGPHGEKLAGNLDLFAAGDYIHIPNKPILLTVLRNGSPVSGFLGIRKLDDGATLVVGRDIKELAEIKSLIGQAVVAATLVALLLVLIGTIIFRRELRKRVEAIRDTAFHVGIGELTHRIPMSLQQDEFAYLRNDINHMLDQIETLMKGVQNVSDSIAHNMRTPLTRVLAKLDRIQHGSHDSTSLSKAISSVSDEIMGLISVAEKLLLIAETESGVRRQIFKPIDLEKIARDVMELYEPLAGDKGTVIKHRVIYETVAVSPHILGDADLLAGAISNLVENALKYAGDGAHITIDIIEYAGHIKLAMTDDGSGVADDNLGQLGTRFYRLRPDIPGSGLGLASVRAIVLLHGGTLRFQGLRPGFSVELEFPVWPIT